VDKREEQENNMAFNEILKGCYRGDLKAQEDLFRLYWGYVMSIALRFSSCHDNALEIANDSFLKIFLKIGSHKIEKDFKAWIRKIVINTAMDYFRKDKRNNIEIPIEIANNDPVEESVIDSLNAEEIIKLVNSLPKMYRYTFSLFEIEGFSHEEIAIQFGITPSTSRSNLTRAKKMLRQMILITSKYERVG
jgi:RNA polymerase sigma factor (sigma-70 family)